ncbi:MAG TPA: zinc-ribbon domain-containing transport protein [Elusimicrobiota bacterium]|nr:zinc-ribbon domain-containing transport protein [Elusimicrobiota bacterium]
MIRKGGHKRTAGAAGVFHAPAASFLGAAALVLLGAAAAYARAGGGGGYSGGFGGGGFSGGGFSGGGGGGGGGLGLLLYWYIAFVAQDPVVGLPLTLVIGYVLWQIYGRADPVLATTGQMHRAIAQGQDFQDRQDLEASLAALKARDPKFDAEAFLKRAQDAFLKIQSAWSRQDLSPARPFVSDGVMERFLIQIGMQQALGERDDMSQVQVLGADILEMESDRCFDALHVRFLASAADQMVSTRDGRRISGSASAQEFSEIWTFLRRPGAKTLSGAGLIEGCCPNCGAPLSLADAGRCESCKSWVNSGEYDWVLCEITQECEWAPRGAEADIPGFMDLAAKDAALNAQFLEDRASVAFWRWQMALFEGRTDAAMAVAAPEFLSTLAADIAAKTESYRESAVGAVEVRCVETGAPFDRAHVLVKWSGDRWTGRGSGAAFQENVLRQHVFILKRKSGVLTEARSGLCSLRCPNCGAPQTQRDQVRCEYCGTPFNDGASHWVVEDVRPIGEWSPPKSALQTPAAPAADDWAQALSPAEALTVVALVVSANGRQTPETASMMAALAKRYGIAPEKIPALLAAARSGQVQMPVPQNREEARACLRGLARLILMEGPVTRPEVKLLNEFAARYGYSRADVRLVFRAERLALYRRAKAALRSSEA